MFMNEIKIIVQNLINDMKITDYLCGEIITVSPLTIKISPKIILNEQSIILTANTTSLIEGDKVHMLRVMQGQQFLVLSKVV